MAIYTLIYNFGVKMTKTKQNMKRILSLLLTLCMVAGVSAQSLPQDAETRKGQLPNGLTYYYRRNWKSSGQANLYKAQ